MAYFNLGCNNDWERIMDLYFFYALRRIFIYFIGRTPYFIIILNLIEI